MIGTSEIFQSEVFCHLTDLYSEMMSLHRYKFLIGVPKRNSHSETNKEIERQNVDFVEPSKSQNDEIIDRSCNRFETKRDPSDNPPDFDRAANIVSPLIDSPIPKAGPNFQTNSNTMSQADVPYPKKAFNEKTSKNGREKGKSRVYTETPEKIG